MWVKSPKLFSENIHLVICTANIQKCPDTCNTFIIHYNTFTYKWGGHILPFHDALRPHTILTDEYGKSGDPGKYVDSGGSQILVNLVFMLKVLIMVNMVNIVIMVNI